jgi:hypothetical protein
MLTFMQQGSPPGKSLQERAGDVVESAIVGLVGDLLKWAGVAALAAIGLLIWQGGSVPAWLAVAVVLVTLLLAALARRPLWRQTAELHGVATFLDYALARHENYTSHVAEVLNNLQRVIAGDLGVSMAEYIERGILEPAREYLMSEPSENVRLAILTPSAEDDTKWKMVLAAGHSLPGREKYHEPIARTMSRYAYETGQPQSWNDVTIERGFSPTPMATRPFCSMISLPILSGDDVLGVFNVISAEASAFDPAEERYIASLGGAINVAVGLWLKEIDEPADDSDQSPC